MQGLANPKFIKLISTAFPIHISDPYSICQDTKLASEEGFSRRLNSQSVSHQGTSRFS